MTWGEVLLFAFGAAVFAASVSVAVAVAMHLI